MIPPPNSRGLMALGDEHALVPYLTLDVGLVGAGGARTRYESSTQRKSAEDFRRQFRARTADFDDAGDRRRASRHACHDTLAT